MIDINGKQIKTGDRVKATGRGPFSDGEYVVLGVDASNDVRVVIRSVVSDPDFGFEEASAYSDEIAKI